MLAQNSDKQQFSINTRDQQFKYNIRNNREETTPFTSAVDTITNRIDIESLKRKIDSITQYQKPYISKLFCEVLVKNLQNAKIICDYIIAEQNEFNIKESTKEDKIKRLFQLSRFFHHNKSFFEMNKEDILDFLNSLRKPSHLDLNHRSIGTWNGRQMLFLKFFKWLYNPNESDPRKRETPDCMKGIKQLPRKEISSYKPDDMWTNQEHAIFLKYCPNPRDRCYHAMAFDTSCRPSELLSRKISDIKFKTSTEGIQYAEITVNGKTGCRTLPLIESIPYVKEWIQYHPTGTNPNSWLFISMSNKNKSIYPLTRDGLLKHYKEQYRDRLFPNLLKDKNVPEVDKSYIRNMLTKPFNLYIFRHSALTEKSSYLKEHMLRSHAGWSLTSKMPQRYLHYFGTESSKSILQIKGVIKENENIQNTKLKPRHCPNCNECNKTDSKFCIKCKMILTYDSYSKTLEEKRKQENRINQLELEIQQLNQGQQEILELLKYPDKLSKISRMD
jgi:integrase